jgi:GTP-binding protein EngB required for normal cell division
MTSSSPPAAFLPNGIGDRNAASNQSQAVKLSELFDRMMVQVASLGADFGPQEQRLNDLRHRLDEGTLHLAVLGQFKRGKSSVLNALIGEAMLPTAVVPLTSIPIMIRQGSSRSAEVFFRDGRSSQKHSAERAEEIQSILRRFAAEEGNPRNRLRVERVEVTASSPLLERGVVLIDTPGIGSTHRHNTDAALDVLPQCDAAFFVVSIDPPLTETELVFLKQVKTRVPRLFFLLNKIDYVDARERKDALRFLSDVLREQAGIEGEIEIFPVSARKGLAARLSNDGAHWQESGFADLERHVLDFLSLEKTKTLEEAILGKLRDIASDINLRLGLALRSLEMPLAELQSRLELFEGKILEAESQRRQARDLLSGDKKRMVEALEAYATNLRSRAKSHLEGVVERTLSTSVRPGEREAEVSAAKAIPAFFETEIGAAIQFSDRKIEETLTPHQARAEDLIESVRKAVSDLFDIPYKAPGSRAVFRLVRAPYWVTHDWGSLTWTVPRHFLNSFSSRERRVAGIRKRMSEQIGTLVLHNVENLRWSIFQSIEHAFRRFASELDARLDETIEATHGAIRLALAKREEHSHKIDGEVARLSHATAEMALVERLLWRGANNTSHGQDRA